MNGQEKKNISSLNNSPKHAERSTQKKRIGCHPDIRLKKTNYLKTNLTRWRN